MKKPVRILIDGHEHEVDGAANLLEAALGLGYDLPYFCWHPALGSVGACRQCAVMQYKDEHDATGRMVMACMTPCADQARFSIAHAEAKEMRASVVELLMTNHPHDCPVCEEGGHCHLQDMTVMTGHNYRRYRHTKRTHRNQDLGPFVGHEMNRCIACYRCVRFYRDYAGGTDLDVFGIGSEVYFGRAADGTLENEFSGNLVEVCPTGVFTDKPYGGSYTRKWDLQTAPGICTHCSIGCNISPGERYGKIKRIENRYHGDLNGYFLCDRGRYGYGFVNRDDRPRHAHVRRAQGLERVSSEDAVAQVAALLRRGGVIGVGSPRASLEANFALREVVGAENFFQGQEADACALDARALAILRQGPARIASIRDAEQCDAVLVLGEDVLNTGARLALALRQATRQAGYRLAAQAHIPAWQDASVRTLAQDRRSPLFVATPAATGLDAVAAATFRGTPGEIARLGAAVAHRLDPGAPAVAGLDPETERLAEAVAGALRAARRPLVVSGTGCGSGAVLDAAAAVASALAKANPDTYLGLVSAECNSAGAALLGGRALDAALARVRDGGVRGMLVLENDLFRRTEPGALRTALGQVPAKVVLDCVGTETLALADVILPAGSFAESDGTLVNFEGRAQRYFQVTVPRDTDIWESWRWLQRIAPSAGVTDLGETLEALTEGCAQAVPALAGIRNAAPGAKFRMAGAKIPRQPHRYSGRTAMDAQRDVHEQRPARDHDSALAFSMEGATGLGPKPAPLIPMFWSPGWNSPQSINKFQDEIGGSLRGGDPGVRLLEPGPGAPAYPKPAADGRVTLQAVPLHFLFGSEELSALAPVMAARIAPPRVALHPERAAELGLADGARAELGWGSARAEVTVAVREGIARNGVGLPAGLPGIPRVAAGTPVTLKAVRT